MQRADTMQQGSVRSPTVARAPFPAWLLPAALWLAIVAWRPAFLGFYHDDWATLMPMSASAAAKFLAEQASRPVYGMLMSVARLVLPAQPVWYQGLLVLLIAASAFAIGCLGRRVAVLAGASLPAARWAGAFSAATWISIPWSMGVSVWPTTFPAQISVIAFCAMAVVILGEAPLRKRMVRGLSIFFFASLISELFWVSFAPLLLILLGTGGRWLDRAKVREVAIFSVGFVAIQGVLVLQNRLWVLLGVGINRSFNAAWPETARLSASLVPSEFSKAVVLPQAAWMLLGAMVVVALAGAMRAGRARFVSYTLLAMLGGMLVSLLLFALAGYRVEAFGIFSRTTVVISVWLCLLPALVVAATSGWPERLRPVGSLLVLPLVALLAVSAVRNTQPWIASWRFEQELLDSLPGERLARAAPGSGLLIDATKPEGAAEGLEAFWDTSGAIYLRRPDLRAVFSPDRVRHFAVMADVANKQTTWNGKEMVQAWCHSPEAPLWSLPASGEVYVWSYPSGRLERLDPGARLGCKPKAQ